MKICKLKDCKETITRTRGYGLCNKHYLKLYRYGDPEIIKSPRHGMTNTPTHNSWLNMIKRCSYTGDINYSNYGGRGIKVCDRWLGVNGFINFFEDLGERPEGMTLDRIDSDGNYEPNNCRWATPTAQIFNRRRNHVPGIERISKNSWRATIGLNYKKIRLGYFPTKQKAIEARQEAETKLLIGSSL